MLDECKKDKDRQGETAMEDDNVYGGINTSVRRDDAANIPQRLLPIASAPVHACISTKHSIGGLQTGGLILGLSQCCSSNKGDVDWFVQ